MIHPLATSALSTAALHRSIHRLRLRRRRLRGARARARVLTALTRRSRVLCRAETVRGYSHRCRIHSDATRPTCRLPRDHHARYEHNSVVRLQRVLGLLRRALPRSEPRLGWTAKTKQEARKCQSSTAFQGTIRRFDFFFLYHFSGGRFWEMGYFQGCAEIPQYRKWGEQERRLVMMTQGGNGWPPVGPRRRLMTRRAFLRILWWWPWGLVGARLFNKTATLRDQRWW